MPGIALNLFPLTTTQFTITLYRLPYSEVNRPSVGDEQAVRRSFCINGSRDYYWTLFQQIDGGIATECESLDNVPATIAGLRVALLQSCQRNLNSGQCRVVDDFRRLVEITVGETPEGLQVISLDPYFLRLRRQFCIRADFRFHPKEEYRGTRKALQLSLSLDQHGQPNKNRYADRYSQLSDFVKKFHSLIFPLILPGGNEVNVGPRLVELPAETLDIKHYIVGSNSESRSQFMGVKQSGPLRHTPDNTRICFLYRPADRPLSHDLFRALRGDTFRTFPGMEQMFRLSLRNERVSGIPILDFNYNEIERVAERVVSESNGANVIPVVLTPFSRHEDPANNSEYWSLKHAFLSKKLPLQVVANETVANKNKLKWSIAGIGLQIFAKAGGIPWKVRPQTDHCLIVGVGQAHQIADGKIERYFAYSVLTDSSGIFEEVRILGEGSEEGHYITEFTESLRNIFDEYSDRFSNFVVHTTFAIRRNELESIASILADKQSQWTDGNFASLKFNDRNRFFGFAGGHNSRVPHESSMISLSSKEFLVWFEGLQYGQPTINKMVGNPLHVQFTFPQDGLPKDRQRAYLQDAINLSGANWRGFNAKSLPISVYYAQIIAKYLKEFESHDLPPIDVNTLTPWFL